MEKIKKSTLRLLVVIMFALLTVSGVSFSIYLIYYGAHTTFVYIIATTFLILSAVSGFFNTFTSYSYYRSASYDEYFEKITRATRPLTAHPTVALIMPVYNEDTKVVRKNLDRLRALDYPKNRITTYLLDDSTNADTRRELTAYAKKNGLIYLHRDDRKGFKAGALNNMLRHSKEEYIAIFDYDEYITDTAFLKDTLPYFADKSLAYVQTEKRYFKGSFFSDTVDLFDAFFFKFIQPSRALNNTAIFAGSCGVIRRSALDKIGGFPEYIIEDTFFSFESDMHNYTSLYVPKVYAYGKPIETFTELVKQQWRYNYGDTQFLMYFAGRKHERKDKKQSTMSKIDYITHGFGLNYVSLVLIMFTFVSIFIVFAATSPQAVNLHQIIAAQNITTTIEILGIGSFIISIIAPIVLTKVHFKSIRKGFMVFLLNFSLSFVRTKAAIAAAFHLSPSSGWAKGGTSPKGSGGKAISIFSKTFTESMFSSMLFVLGGLALLINNLYGAVWLIWYAILYSSTFIFFYKYG